MKSIPPVFRYKSRWIAGIVLVGLLSVMGGCSGAQPKVLFADASHFVVLDPTSSRRYESIRLFISVQDDDGAEDIAAVYVVHDQSELFWEFDASSWVRTEYGGDAWIGISDIRGEGASLPRGTYRVIVEDGALQRSEGRFIITGDPVDLESVEFPVFSVTPSGPVVEHREVVLFRVYTRSGQMVVNQEVSPGAVPAEVIRQVPEESGLKVILIAEYREGIRLLAGPYDYVR